MFASTIGQLAHPFYVAFAWAIAEFYRLVPNYAVAIALLTIAVMIVVFPITLRGTRGMMKMQLLAPEIKKLQAKYKAVPGMSVAERQDLRQRQQEELMALYKENNVSPTGGCVPMFLQLPIFLILYGTIRGLTHSVISPVTHKPVSDPLYISHTSLLYERIHAENVHATTTALNAFGINLADSVRTPGLSWAAKIPFIVLILVAIGLQYVQMKQLSGRNPQAAAANPQMQQMQKFFPIIFAVIYISIPAGVNIYFIVSSLFRICQQEYMYRHDPHIQESLSKLRARTRNDPITTSRLDGPQPRGFRARLAQAAASSGLTPSEPAGNGNGSAPTKPSHTPPGSTGAARPKKVSARSAPPPRAAQSRSQNKRPRRPR